MPLSTNSISLRSWKSPQDVTFAFYLTAVFWLFIIFDFFTGGSYGPPCLHGSAFIGTLADSLRFSVSFINELILLPLDYLFGVEWRIFMMFVWPVYAVIVFGLWYGFFYGLVKLSGKIFGLSHFSRLIIPGVFLIVIGGLFLSSSLSTASDEGKVLDGCTSTAFEV